jgi:hypothetical protein
MYMVIALDHTSRRYVHSRLSAQVYRALGNGQFRESRSCRLGAFEAYEIPYGD